MEFYKKCNDFCSTITFFTPNKEKNMIINNHLEITLDLVNIIVLQVVHRI